ncbi:MAG: hypothetical protein B6245_01755 [Desulfobacteraceae bacterium 4572_88]|nr:MAG: hypothetical protein B6245_01755 [Desulfobacteraceae bacterium 4572_88]
MSGTIPIRIILPAILTVLLLVMTIFLLILPPLEDRLMEGKREVIHELTEIAWSTLSLYAEKEKNGVLAREGTRVRVCFPAEEAV